MDTNKEWYNSVYLKSEHWKEIRKMALWSAGYKCEKCSCSITLQVHHRTYKNKWKEQREDVQVLCNDCHLLEHKKCEKHILEQILCELTKEIESTIAERRRINSSFFIDPDPDGSWEWE